MKLKNNNFDIDIDNLVKDVINLIKIIQKEKMILKNLI